MLIEQKKMTREELNSEIGIQGDGMMHPQIATSNTSISREDA